MLPTLAMFRPRHACAAMRRVTPKGVVALLMVATVSLRVVSGFPSVPTPHEHGAEHHTHAAGGLAHQHPTPALSTPAHRHGDGPYHVHCGHSERATAFTRTTTPDGGYSITIPVRHLPDARQGEDRHGHDAPPRSEREQDDRGAAYYSAAASPMVDARPLAAHQPQGDIRLPVPHVEGASGTVVGRMRQARAPPCGITHT